MVPRADRILLFFARIKTLFLNPVAHGPVTTPTELSQFPPNAECVFMNEMSAIRTNKCKCVNSLCVCVCVCYAQINSRYLFSPSVIK
jgi:hypothetical protein